MPVFLIEGGWPLAMIRAISVAGLVAGFGSLLYRRVTLPPNAGPQTRHRLRVVSSASLGFAVAGAGLWLIAQTADFAGSFTLGNLRAVIAETEFGHLVIARIALLLLAGAALRAGAPSIATLLAGAALALQSGHSHAWAMHGAGALWAANLLHLLAAGAWLGGLLPLLLVVVHEAPPVALAASRRFSRVGFGCVVLILMTAVVQASAFIPTRQALLHAAYGWTALSKMLGLAGLLSLAAANFFLHTPALSTDPQRARPALARSIAVELLIALLILAAAGILTELPPPAHHPN